MIEKNPQMTKFKDQFPEFLELKNKFSQSKSV